MTDQDLDGSHIKGLCVNLFESQWKSLIKASVIGFMNTPILKPVKGTKNGVYNEQDMKNGKKVR